MANAEIPKISKNMYGYIFRVQNPPDLNKKKETFLGRFLFNGNFVT